MNETIKTIACEIPPLEPSTTSPVPVLLALQTAGSSSGQKETINQNRPLTCGPTKSGIITMDKKTIDRYRDAVDKYDDTTLTSDDLILEKKIEKFYKTPTLANHYEIAAYLLDKALSSNAGTLAVTLDGIMNLVEQTTEPVPALKAVAITTTDSMVPPAILPATAEIKAEPSAAVKSKEVGEVLHLAKPAASVPVPDNVFYIEPDAIVKVHPSAAEFPLMEGDEYEQFKDRIRLGQQSPVIMLNGELLDGRNRLKACRELGIKTMAMEYRGNKTAEELIADLNIHRRHLTPSQRAALAVKLLPALEREAAERMEAGKSNPSQKIFQGKSVDIAGKQVGVSGEYVAKAKKIADTAPAAFQGLLNGSTTLAQATKQMVKEETSTQPAQPAPRCCSLTDALAEIIKLVAEDRTEELDEIFEDAVRKTIALIPEASDGKLLAFAQDAPAVVRKAIEFWFEKPAAAEETKADAALVIQSGFDF